MKKNLMNQYFGRKRKRNKGRLVEEETRKAVGYYRGVVLDPFITGLFLTVEERIWINMTFRGNPNIFLFFPRFLIGIVLALPYPE